MNESLLAEYKQLTRDIEELESLKAEIAAKIKESLNGQEKAICGQYKISYSDTTRVSVNAKELEKSYPDIYSKVSRISTYKVLRVS